MSALALVVGLAACGGPAGTHRAQQAPESRSVTIAFRGTDGLEGEGTFVPAAGAGRAPVVILVHEYRGGPELWVPLLPALHGAGFASFRFGLRKFGELEENVDARDVLGALAVLRRRADVDPARVAVIGAGVGGAAAA
jgi:cephalosporin-C deacetylase-like acetyl esterase